MTTETLWQMEEDFWLRGADFFERAMAPDALMVFPAPVGVLNGGAVLESLRGVPRWSSCTFEDKAEAEAGDAAALVYKVCAMREGAAPYHAICTSTYVRSGETWLLLAHQQMAGERVRPQVGNAATVMECVRPRTDAAR